ncbi:hypothetical protein [Streptomyces sp. NBC_01216]|uniref:hypothetical protein n=1 Tax=unclassified Streptomyces TaxID=2593676 RepID=UPI002E14D943|nr:hypothetical protein OG393_07295 [Streptomyces sp. NBC_01216]
MVRLRVPAVTHVRVAGALLAGGLWWWAVLRLALVPAQSGLVEGAVAAGGWGLSLLPVHVTASAAAGGRGERSEGATSGARFTTASRPRRSDGGSDPS